MKMHRSGIGNRLAFQEWIFAGRRDVLPRDKKGRGHWA